MNNENRDEVVYLNLDDIIPNRFQPREVFDERALKELAISIKEHGVIQPIIVRNVNGKYEIIAGERRYKASALAGLTKIPAIIRDIDDKESSKVALLENLQRKNLNAIEEARTYQKILELDEMTQDELAKTMGKSQSAVANKIRLLSLPDEIQDAVLKEKISERHARALLNIPESKKQKEMLKKVISERMPVRKLENEIKKMYPKEASEKKTVEEVVNMENKTVDLPDSDIVASTSDFVKDNPLIPTTEIQEESNYGKVIIAPPEGEEENVPKFINYGEIDDEEDDNDDYSEEKNLDSDINKNIEEIKSNASDINQISQKTNDLDSLLNITPISEDDESEKNRFITPAEGIVKNDIENKDNIKSEDYFKTPDLINIELPAEVQNKNNNDNDSQNNSEEHKKENSVISLNEDNYTIQSAVETLRKFVSDLNKHEIAADIEEMNFNKSYQIIIKIEKPNE